MGSLNHIIVCPKCRRTQITVVDKGIVYMLSCSRYKLTRKLKRDYKIQENNAIRVAYSIGVQPNPLSTTLPVAGAQEYAITACICCHETYSNIYPTYAVIDLDKNELLAVKGGDIWSFAQWVTEEV